MSTTVPFVDNMDRSITVRAQGFPEGTVLDPLPTVVLVLNSKEGDYLGHLETDPESAHILSEYIRKAAEAASQKEEGN